VNDHTHIGVTSLQWIRNPRQQAVSRWHAFWDGSQQSSSVCF